MNTYVKDSTSWSKKLNCNKKKNKNLKLTIRQ